MSIDEILSNIRLFFILIVILTVTTEVGFLIQKMIIDIRLIVIAAAIAVLSFIILLGTNIVLASLVSLILYVGILDRLLSRYDETFGVILASTIGVGVEVIIVFNYAGSIFPV